MKLNRRTVIAAGAAAAASPLLTRAARAAGEEPFKVGFVYVGPIGDHGWTYAHNQGRLLIEETFGDKVETTFVESVKEGPDAERVIRQLAQSGHKLIFTTSFGFMNPTIKVAKSFPDVMFEHATGYQQAANVASYNARFFEGRAVIGTIAGHMSKSGKAGYIASFPIPEVVMGINSFTLAAQKVNPDFETTVLWVNSWFDPPKEADAAKAMIDQGVDVLTQHTDSPAALQAAEERGVFAFGQASEMSKFGPNAHLTAILNTWGPYYVERVRAAMDGSWTSGSHWTGLKTGLVGIADYNPVLPDDAVAAAEAMRTGIIDGSAHPFVGPILDQDGVERVAAGERLADKDIAVMDWYVKGVQS